MKQIIQRFDATHFNKQVIWIFDETKKDMTETNINRFICRYNLLYIKATQCLLTGQLGLMFLLLIVSKSSEK
jgi:hypothetical protein